MYTGNYSSFERQYHEQLALQEAMYLKQQRKIKHMMVFVDRFRYKASKSKQAQSRLKSISKLEHVAALQATSEFSFEFTDPGRVPAPILSARHLTLGYGDTVVLDNVNLQLHPGDRIGLLGINGAGKSTLIKGLLGDIPALSGELERGHKLRVGYFAQHQIDFLQPDQSPLEHLQELDKKVTAQIARNYFGGFAFKGDMAVKPIINFSGGEKSRLALALIIWQRPHLLLLDEPTNHLDMEMRNALSIALQSFQGAMILVSHDRSLLECSTDRLYLIKDGSVKEFEGDLNDYQREVLAQDSKQKTVTKAQKPIKDNKQIAKLEKKIQKLESILKKLDEKLAAPSIYEPDNAQKLKSLQEEHESIKQQLSAAEEAWVDLHDD